LKRRNGKPLTAIDVTASIYDLPDDRRSVALELCDRIKSPVSVTSDLEVLIFDDGSKYEWHAGWWLPLLWSS